MPLSSYQCSACLKHFDAFVRFGRQDEPGPPCPQCGSADTKFNPLPAGDDVCPVGLGAEAIK